MHSQTKGTCTGSKVSLVFWPVLTSIRHIFTAFCLVLQVYEIMYYGLWKYISTSCMVVNQWTQTKRKDSPVSMDIVVVLPAPLCPSNTVIWPLYIFKNILFTATFCPRGKICLGKWNFHELKLWTKNNTIKRH